MDDLRYYINLIEGVETAAENAVIKLFPDRKIEIQEYFEWAKSIFPRQDFMNWYKNQLIGLFNKTISIDDSDDFERYCDTHLDKNIPKIQSFRFTNPNMPVKEVIQEFEKITKEYHEKQDKEKGVPIQTGDYKLFEFTDGFAWWYIDRAYCPEEGRSGQHCGNVTGQEKTDQKILSFRNDKNQVLMTFVLEPDHTLGEMKAKGNQKPNKKYHPYIMKLLLWDEILGISGLGYFPEMNFSIFDLDKQNLHIIDQQKPNLIISQLKIEPMELLFGDDAIKQKYIKTVPYYIRSVINNPNDVNNWIEAVNNDRNIIIQIPPELWDEFPDYKEQLIKIISYDRRLILKAPKCIAKNVELLKEIIAVQPGIIEFISPHMKEYTELCKLSITKHSYMFNLIPEQHRSKELCQFAFSKYPHLIVSIPEKFITPKMCEIAVYHDVENILHVPIKMSNYKSLAEYALHKNINVIFSIDKTMRTPEMYRFVVSNNPNFIIDFPKDIVNYTELWTIALSEKPSLIEYADPEYKDYPKLAELVVKKDPLLIDSISNQTPNYLELCKIALKHNLNNIKIIPNKSQELYDLYMKMGGTLTNIPPKYQSKYLQHVNEDLFRIIQLVNF